MMSDSSSGAKPSFDASCQVSTEEELRALYASTHTLAVQKCIDHLDHHCQKFISLSPFLCLATQHANGTADVSPRGDPAGFATVLDRNTLVIPDRPGNNRLDSLSNIISNPAVGLLFMVPGFEDTLRVNGTARLVRDPELLQTLAVANRVPTLAIVVHVNEAFLHCAKALRRSKLWDTQSQRKRSEMTSMIAMVMEHSSGNEPAAETLPAIEQDLEEEYQQTMY